MHNLVEENDASMKTKYLDTKDRSMESWWAEVLETSLIEYKQREKLHAKKKMKAKKNIKIKAMKSIASIINCFYLCK